MKNKLVGKQLQGFLVRNDVSLDQYEQAYAEGKNWCSKCHQFLLQDAFSPRKGRPGRVNSYCKECIKRELGAYHAEYQRKHPEKLKEYHKQYYEKNKGELRY